MGRTSAEPGLSLLEPEVFDVDAAGALVAIAVEDHHPGRPPARSLEIRARRGHRLGVIPGRSLRRGHREEIVQPLAVLPATATLVALGHEFLLTPLPSLEVDVASRNHDGDCICWQATLRTGRFSRRRGAALYLHPAPSANLSVLELIPSNPRRLHTQRFIRAGVVAVDSLARRLALHATAVADDG